MVQEAEGARSVSVGWPGAQVASLAPKVAASWFGAPAPLAAARAYAPASLKAMAPKTSAAAQPEKKQKKSFWTAVKEKAGLKPKEAPAETAWNTPAADEEGEEAARSWATQSSNAGWDTPAAAGSRWDTERDTEGAGEGVRSSSGSRAVPAVASASKALAAREQATRAGSNEPYEAPSGAEDDETGSLVPQTAAPTRAGGGDAFDRIHGGEAQAQTEEVSLPPRIACLCPVA